MFASSRRRFGPLVVFVIAGWLGSGLPTFAQAPADFPKVAVELRGGMASPTIDFTGYDRKWEPGTSGAFGANLVARPERHLGLDIGIDVVVHAFGAGGTKAAISFG